MSDGFGTRVKALRKNIGLTQQQLAEKLNIHERTVSKWERGLCEPDFGVYGLLSEALGVSLEELWGLPAPHERAGGKFDALSFGKTISFERKRRGESQEKLAKAVAVSPNTVSKWERGVICPDIETFFKLAEYFGVQPSKFYYSLCADGGVKAESNGGASVRPRGRKKAVIALVASVVLVILALMITLICVLPNCGDNKPDSDVTKPPATECEHDYTEKTVSASCTAQGYTLHTCTKCGESYKSDYTPQTEHTAGEWVTDRTATCKEYGSRHLKCAVCGATMRTEQTEKAQHDYTEKTVSASCTAQGYTLHTCTKCGESYKSDYTPQTEHSYASETFPPDGQGYGYTLFTCINCGESYRDDFTLPPESQLLYSFDFDAKTCTLAGIGENGQPVIEIPSYVSGCKVISIAGRAFEDCVTLREITIPDGVIEIESYAFHRCANLKKVVLPDSILFIGNEAFCGCRLLESVTLPSKITRLRYSVFSDCVSLKSIEIPSGVTVLEDLAFHNCQSLGEIILPESLTYIGVYAFYDCVSLQKIVIPEGVTFIGDNAFTGCSALTDVKLENTAGWTAGGEPLSMAELADRAVAAAYLTQAYNLKIWTRE